MPSFDKEEMMRTMQEEFATAWQALTTEGQLYSFGLYTTDTAGYISVTASSEEGLDEVAARYAKRSGNELALERTALRWSPCDSPLHVKGEDFMIEANELRQTWPDPYEDSSDAAAAIEAVFTAAVEALRSLDQAGVFGVGQDRERVVLGIWMGDQSDENRIQYAGLLNPPSVVDRLRREFDEVHEAYAVRKARRKR